MPNAEHRVCRKKCTLQTTGRAEKSEHCKPQGVQKKMHTAEHRVCRKKCTLQSTGCAEKSAYCRPQGVQKKVHTAELSPD